MHNLTDEEWKAKKLSVATWEANVAELPQQKVIKEVLARNANASFGPNCYIAPDCNFFTDSARLGRNVRIASQVTLRGNITMGNDVSVNPLTNIIGNVKIGTAVRIASSVQIFGFNHGFDRVDKYIKDQPITSKGIEIGEGTWIGAGGSIVDGVKIGAHCVVAAGAVVTKSFPDFSIIGGVPAKLIKSRIKKTDFQINVTNLANTGKTFEYCLDLPRTGVLEATSPYLNAWLATVDTIEAIVINNGNIEQAVSGFHERPDVKEYLSKTKPVIVSNGKVLGFKIGPIQENVRLDVKVNGTIIHLVQIVVKACLQQSE
ncbi:acyltransferase [Alteromonas oceani]|uniref:Acyltransferase n=1 Tax=Alteromonas oceani TaxID=2071609 RepID=A0ABV7K0L3_9ALTE|nr:acyltransferase [Alteromonas oceani]